MDSDEPPHLRLITADDVPGVPARRPARSNLRWAIAVVGFGQVLLGLGQVFAVSFMKAVDGGHFVNESAAWNMAIGTALLHVARTGRCSTGVLIMMVAFVGLLTVVTLGDVLNGWVGGARLATHILVVTGCTLTGLLRRHGADQDGP